MRLKLKMHGDQPVRVVTRDDNDGEILDDFESSHPQPGATRQDERRRRLLLGSLPYPRFQIEKDGALWRVWDSSPDEEPAAAMSPGSALSAALKNASHDAAARSQDGDDRRIAANASLPMRERLQALSRINARAKHDLR